MPVRDRLAEMQKASNTSKDIEKVRRAGDDDAVEPAAVRIIDEFIHKRTDRGKIDSGFYRIFF